jgi:Recombination endonuclease VII
MGKRRAQEAINEAEQQKTCVKCKVRKPFAEFYASRIKDEALRGYNGLDQRCRSCCIAKAKAYNKKHPERHRHSEQKYRSLSPQKARERDLRARFRRYGLTIESYTALYELQGGVCGICADPMEIFARFTHVDHCHKTGRVRGLLCHACNCALAYLRDDPTRALAAARYLDRGGLLHLVKQKMAV